MTSGLTRQDGSFNLTTKGGTYLFQVDLTGFDLNQAHRRTDPQAIEPQAMAIGRDEAGEFKATETGSGDDDSPTAGPSTPATTTPAGGGTPGPTSPGTTPGGDADDGSPGGGPSDGGGSDGESLPPDGWRADGAISGYQASVRKGQTKIIFMAIKVDRDLDQFLEAPDKTCTLGRTCTISFARQADCSIDVPLFDGAVVNTPQAGMTYNQSLGVATIEAENPYSTSLTGMRATGPEPSIQPGVSTAQISFTPPTTLQMTSTDLHPVMWCRGTRHELQARRITFNRDLRPKVHIALISATQTRFTVENDHGSPLVGELVATFESDGVFLQVTNAGGCDNHGNGVVCTVGEDNPIIAGVNQGTRSWTVTTAQVGPPIEDNTTITIRAKWRPNVAAPAAAPAAGAESPDPVLLPGEVEADPATRFIPGVPEEEPADE